MFCDGGVVAAGGANGNIAQFLMPEPEPRERKDSQNRGLDTQCRLLATLELALQV